MDRSPRHRPVLRQRIAALALIAPLSLSACSSADDDTQTPGDSAPSTTAVGADPSDADRASRPSAGNAEFVTASESISFSVAFCVIDDVDILVHGPGEGDESGDPAYLDVDMGRTETNFTSGGARVDLGSTDQFSSSEDFYSLSIDAGHEYEMLIDGKSFELEGNFHYAGDPDLHPGTLSVDCR